MGENLKKTDEKYEQWKEQYLEHRNIEQEIVKNKDEKIQFHLIENHFHWALNHSQIHRWDEGGVRGGYPRPKIFLTRLPPPKKWKKFTPP